MIAVSNYSTLGGPTLPFYRPPKWAKKKDQKNGICPFIMNSMFFCELSCLCGLPFFQNIVHWGGPLFQNIVYWGGPPPQIIAIKRQVGPPPPKSKGHVYTFFPECVASVPVSLGGLGVRLCSPSFAFATATVRKCSQPPAVTP